MSLLSRIKQSRLVQVVLVYLGASWVVVEAADLLQQRLALPPWIVPVTIILLLVGLVVVAATAWVQGSPTTDRREAAGEVPTDWELDLGDLARSLRGGRVPHLTWGRAALGGAGALAILALLVVLFRAGPGDDGPRPALAGDSAAPGVAVLPFRTSGQGLDSWREGMVDLLSRNLDGLGGLRAIDSRTVLARWTEAVEPGASPDLATALDVADRAGARWALLGSAVEVGPRVRVTADIYQVESGRRLDGASAEGAPDSLLALVDGLSVDVARTLLAREEPDLSGLRLSSITTALPEALRHFLEGEAAFRRLSFGAAIESFEAAVALDPGFALAHYRLGAARGWAGGVSADTERELAYEHRDRLPERERLMVEADYRAREGALRSGVERLRQGVRRYPDDPEMWYQLGDVYLHFGFQIPVGTDEAEEALRRAVALDPGFAPYRTHLVDLALIRGDSAEAARLLEAEAATAAPGSRELRAHRLAFDYLYGSEEERDAVLAALDTVPERVASWLNLPFTLEGDRAGDFLALETAVCAPRLAEPDVAPVTQYTCLLTHLANGRIAGARRLMDGLADADQSGVPAFAGFVLRQTGMDPSAPVGDLDDVLPLLPVPAPGADPARFIAGVLAVEQGRPALADSILALFGPILRDREARGDTLTARTGRGYARGLRGYVALADRRPDSARAHLEEAVEALVGTGGPGNAARTLAIWPLAGLYVDAGREQEALRLYRSLWLSLYSGPALLRRAEVHDRLGNDERADRLRAQFLAQWSGADPGHPMVQEARDALGPG